MTLQELLSRLIDDAYESREEVVDSFRSSTVPLPAEEKAAMQQGRISSGVETDEDDVDDVLYGMSVLIDTGVLYADHDTDASRHDAAAASLDAVYDGEFGQPYVSDYVHDEAVTLTLRRTGSFEAARSIGRRLRGADPFPRAYELVHVSRQEFADAVDTFERYDDQQLSFTGAVLIAQCERRDVDAVLSFDDDFDGVVDCLHPSEL